jgi:hypothetical protein
MRACPFTTGKKFDQLLGALALRSAGSRVTPKPVRLPLIWEKCWVLVTLKTSHRSWMP